MLRLIRISIAAAGLAALAGPAAAASLDGLQVFSEREYARIVFSLEGEARTAVEPQPGGELVLVRFDGTDITRLPEQSYVFENNPHVESITFLPLAGGATVARIKLRHPFSLRTYNIGQPPRFVLEVSRAAASSVQGDDNSPNIDYYSHGLEQVRQGSDEAALISFRNAIRSGHSAAESYYQAGLIRMRQRQPQMAEVNFEKSLGSGQYAHESRLFLAWLAHASGDRDSFRRRWNGFSAAVPDPARRLELAAAHPEVDYRAMESAAHAAGLTAITVSTPESLPVAVSPAVESAPAPMQEAGPRIDLDSARAYFDLGLQARNDKHLEQAAAHFQHSLSFNPTNPEACFQLGIVYKDLNRPAESAVWFERSLGKTSGAGTNRAEPVEQRADPEAESLDGMASKAGAPMFPDSQSTDTTGFSAGLAQASGATGQPLPADRAQGAESTPNNGSTAVAAAALQPAGTSPLQRLRGLVGAFVQRTGIPLLRKQVIILTLATGFLFLLTLMGERFALGRFGLRLFGRAGKDMAVKALPAPAAAQPETITLRQAAQSIERRQQVAQVLARELAAKQKAVPADSGAPHPAAQPVAAMARGMDLRVGRPAGSGPVYGADIARRIKEQLASPAVRVEAASAGFSRAREDVKSRLIRQLRAKNWTVSDIAQEMGLSREEVKWALSSSPAAERTAQPKPAAMELGQARALGDANLSRSAARDLDREMELELQINV
ncbi:hypothetical protein LLH00_10180 [bacterium]|nr:hypothetical protein [bacterium]